MADIQKPKDSKSRDTELVNDPNLGSRRGSLSMDRLSCLRRQSTEGAICPYCGELHKAVSTDGGLYRQGIFKFFCQHCDKEFDVIGKLRWSWDTSKRVQ